VAVSSKKEKGENETDQDVQKQAASPYDATFDISTSCLK